MVPLAALSLQVQYCTSLSCASKVADRIGRRRMNSDVSQDWKNEQEIRRERSGGGCLSILN